jgi:uncharacterized protein GlcG (DUF336 family)
MALANCRADGNHVSVTVVDRDGLVKAAFRDDGAGRGQCQGSSGSQGKLLRPPTRVGREQ